MNRDGNADLIVGAFGDERNGIESGSATVFSGADGSTLYTMIGEARSLFGFSVSGAGDVDQDGHADLIVGAYGNDVAERDAGSVRVLSGAHEYSLDTDLDIAGCHLEMQISFHDETGAQVDMEFSTANSFGEALRIAETALADSAVGSNPFVNGRWTLTGPNVSGSGHLTGVIDRGTNPIRIERVYMSDGIPNGPLPAVQPGTISTEVSGVLCDSVITVMGLETDTDPAQEYPNGTVIMNITRGQTTAVATIAFDMTNTAKIEVVDVPFKFEFNLDTHDLNQLDG